MHLKIKPLNDAAREIYSDHGHFHEGDAGLDLYVLEDIVIDPGETKPIKLGISCEPEDGRAYYLMPRSSISSAIQAASSRSVENQPTVTAPSLASGPGLSPSAPSSLGSIV